MELKDGIRTQINAYTSTPTTGNLPRFLSYGHRGTPTWPSAFKQGLCAKTKTVTIRLTDSNLAIATLSLIIFPVRIITSRFHYLPRSVETFYDLLLSILWINSLIGQNSGDFTDLEHISHSPWYLSRGCGASWHRNRTYCRVAQASFAISILAALSYVARLCIDVCMIFREWKTADNNADDENFYFYRGDDCEDGLLHPGLDRKTDPYKEALSPVLAFFPESKRRKFAI